MLVKNTLSAAMAVARTLGKRAVWVVISLDGSAYYVFFSRQTPAQIANSMTRKKIVLHEELKKRTVGGYAATLPTDPAALNTHRQQIFQRTIPHANRAAAESAMDPENRHAEERLIEDWPKCLADYKRRQGRGPRKVEVFLSLSPCFATDPNPSPQRVLGGQVYPVSCQDKLIRFCSTGGRDRMSWKIYYEDAFAGRSFAQANTEVKNVTISNVPPHVFVP